MSEKEKKRPAKAPARVKKAPATAAKRAAPGAKTAAAKSPIVAGIPEVVNHAPTHDQIAARAYNYFLERHGQHGNHMQDWLRAERELRGI